MSLLKSQYVAQITQNVASDAILCRLFLTIQNANENAIFRAISTSPHQCRCLGWAGRGSGTSAGDSLERGVLYRGHPSSPWHRQAGLGFETGGTSRSVENGSLALLCRNREWQ